MLGLVDNVKITFPAKSFNKKRSRPFLIRQNEIVTFIAKHHDSWFGSFFLPIELLVKSLVDLLLIARLTSLPLLPEQQ